MDRREFLARCAAFGASMPVFSLFSACSSGGKYDDFEVNFSGKVAIVGAGAAGLAAGYILDRYGIEFEIIEAGPDIGGRVKRGTALAEFPIDLGAEWIHGTPGLLTELIDDASVQGSVETVPYTPQTTYGLEGGELYRAHFGSEYYSEYKFKRTTWFGFLEQYIAAGIMDRVRLDSPVTKIDYSGDQVVLTDKSGQQYTADRVLITVPIPVLQSDLIEFTPALPQSKTRAIAQVEVPGGLKVFIRFSERFYPDYVEVSGQGYGEKGYYDAAYGKDSPDHVLALFTAGAPAAAYAEMSDAEIFESVMAELDRAFDGAASAAYLDHVVQHWTAEPYIGGAYTFSHGDDWSGTLDALNEPVDGVLHFAGEAYHRWYGSTVHGAMESAYDAIEVLLKG